MADNEPVRETPAKTSNELAIDRTTFAGERTDLAAERTLLAHDRTLMAWTRTATSLISFGFTMYKFFESFGSKESSRRVLGSANFALVMISIGLSCLVLATIQHRRDVRQIVTQYGVKSRSLALAMAALVSLLGILGAVAVAFRL